MNTLVFALFRRIFPVPPCPDIAPAEIEEIEKRLPWLDVVSSAVFIVLLWPLSTVLWLTMLMKLARLYDSTMPQHLLMVRLQPDWLNWALPSLFLGIISGGWLLEFGHLVYFGHEACRRLQAAWNQKTQFDGRKVGLWMTIVFVALSVTWVVADLDWYARLEPNAIVINPLFGLGETAYSYDKISDLIVASQLVAPNGNLVVRDRELVLFNDGSKWCHDGELRDPKPLISLLETKTGKTFRRVRFIEDVVR